MRGSQFHDGNTLCTFKKERVDISLFFKISITFFGTVIELGSLTNQVAIDPISMHRFYSTLLI